MGTGKLADSTLIISLYYKDLIYSINKNIDTYTKTVTITVTEAG